MASIKVDGLKELTAGLKQLDVNLVKQLKAVSKSSADIVAEHARSIAPRRTGRLAGNIKSSGTVKGGSVRVGGLPYHKVIHFGWPAHNIHPNPFMYRALDARRDEVVEKFEREVQALVDKVV